MFQIVFIVSSRFSALGALFPAFLLWSARSCQAIVTRCARLRTLVCSNTSYHHNGKNLGFGIQSRFDYYQSKSQLIYPYYLPHNTSVKIKSGCISKVYCRVLDP